jgi:hypothetical protein
VDEKKSSPELLFFCLPASLLLVFGAVEPIGQNENAENDEHQDDDILNAHEDSSLVDECIIAKSGAESATAST